MTPITFITCNLSPAPCLLPPQQRVSSWPLLQAPDDWNPSVLSPQSSDLSPQSSVLSPQSSVRSPPSSDLSPPTRQNSLTLNPISAVILAFWLPQPQQLPALEIPSAYSMLWIMLYLYLNINHFFFLMHFPNVNFKDEVISKHYTTLTTFTKSVLIFSMNFLMLNQVRPPLSCKLAMVTCTQYPFMYRLFMIFQIFQAPEFVATLITFKSNSLMIWLFMTDQVWFYIIFIGALIAQIGDPFMLGLNMPFSSVFGHGCEVTQVTPKSPSFMHWHFMEINSRIKVALKCTFITQKCFSSMFSLLVLKNTSSASWNSRLWKTDCLSYQHQHQYSLP